MVGNAAAADGQIVFPNLVPRASIDRENAIALRFNSHGCEFLQLLRIATGSGFEFVKWVSSKRFGAAARLQCLAQMTSGIHICAPQFWDVDSGYRTARL
jgi:hypothetical protein